MNEEQERIVLENEKLIYFVLKKYHLYEQCGDFYDLGMLGLCKGAKTYSVEKNTKLSTYLTKCISNEIFSHFRKPSPVTIPLDSVVYENLTLEDTIKDKNIDIERDLIIKTEFERANEIIKSLPDIERLIINYSFNINGYEKMTQTELADYFNLSQAQISRIKNKALEKIKEKLADE